jgi:hypothetical protein
MAEIKSPRVGQRVYLYTHALVYEARVLELSSVAENAVKVEAKSQVAPYGKFTRNYVLPMPEEFDANKQHGEAFWSYEGPKKEEPKS